jgi:hypothetical protein
MRPVRIGRIHGRTPISVSSLITPPALCEGSHDPLARRSVAERSCGIIIEGARAIDGNQLHVRDHEGRIWTVPLGPGDDPEVAARRLLREKFAKHHAFYQTINYFH